MDYDFGQTVVGEPLNPVVNAFEDSYATLSSSLESLASYYTTVRTDGISLSKKMALEMLAPMQFSKIPNGYFTARDTKNGLGVALEAISNGMMALIAAGIAAVLGMVFKFIKWLMGRADSTTSMGQGVATKAANVESLTQVPQLVQAELKTPEAKQKFKEIMVEVERGLTEDQLKDSNGEYAINEVAYGVMTGRDEITAIHKVAKEVSDVLDLSHTGMRIVTHFVAKSKLIPEGETYPVEEELEFQHSLTTLESQVGHVLRSVAPSMKVFSKIDPPKTDDLIELQHYPQKMVDPNTSWVKDNVHPLKLSVFEDIARNSDEAAQRVSEIIRTKEQYLKALQTLQGYILQAKDSKIIKHLQGAGRANVFNPRSGVLKRTTPEVIQTSTRFIQVAIWMSGGHDMLVGAVIRKVGQALQNTERLYKLRISNIETLLEGNTDDDLIEAYKEIKAALVVAKSKTEIDRKKYHDKYSKIIEEGVKLTTLYSDSEIEAMDEAVSDTMNKLLTPTQGVRDAGGVSDLT